jgi:hypothetical protein
MLLIAPVLITGTVPTDPSSMHLKQSINIEYVYKLKPPTWAITLVDIVSNVNKCSFELFLQIRIK